MSKSYGNAILLDDSPLDMYGKVMSLPDEQVPVYFEYCTRMPLDEIASISKSHPKEIKMRLALEIVKLYHSDDAALSAEKSWNEAFSKGGVPEDITTVTASKETSLAEILINNGLVASKSEFNRLNDDGAIKEIEPGTYRIGKHRFIKIDWQ
jgi:tyrosyl-tRNA synthetase